MTGNLVQKMVKMIWKKEIVADFDCSYLNTGPSYLVKDKTKVYHRTIPYYYRYFAIRVKVWFQNLKVQSNWILTSHKDSHFQKNCFFIIIIIIIGTLLFTFYINHQLGGYTIPLPYPLPMWDILPCTHPGYSCYACSRQIFRGISSFIASFFLLCRNTELCCQPQRKRILLADNP